MPKHPTKPGIRVSTDDPDLESSRRLARAAFAKTEQVAQRLDDHIDEDDDKMDALSRDVDAIGQAVKANSEHIGDLRVDMARTLSAVETIKVTIADQRQINHAMTLAEVEARKANRIATIEDATDAKRVRRAIWLKIARAVVAGAVAIVGYLVGWLIGK